MQRVSFFVIPFRGFFFLLIVLLLPRISLNDLFTLDIIIVLIIVRFGSVGLF
tara:strand:- start:263 stop:418 length:156 start_codon:yes stop_codon:yes gene_type:complete